MLANTSLVVLYSFLQLCAPLIIDIPMYMALERCELIFIFYCWVKNQRLTDMLSNIVIIYLLKGCR